MDGGEHLDMSMWKEEEQATASRHGPCIYISVINLSKANGGHT